MAKSVKRRSKAFVSPSWTRGRRFATPRTGTARKNLKLLLAADKRLSAAYLLRESFGQLWGCNREAWARKLFENWRASLQWQRLKPYEKFAEMIERHWE